MRTMERERGQASLEFVIALPLMAATVALLLQLVFLFHSRVVVGHMAQLAAQSAARWVAADVGDRPRIDPQTVKRARQAAAQGAILISPSLDSVAPASSEAVLDGFGAPRGEASSLTPELSAGGRVRLAYALEATEVELKLLPQGDGVTWTVEATVHYDQYLHVPGAAQLLGRSPRGALGESRRFLRVSRRYQAPVVATFGKVADVH